MHALRYVVFYGPFSSHQGVMADEKCTSFQSGWQYGNIISSLHRHPERTVHTRGKSGDRRGGCHRYFSKGASHSGFLFHLCGELVPFLIEIFELFLCFVVLGGEICIVVRIHAHLRGVHLDRRFKATDLHFHMAELFLFYG